MHHEAKTKEDPFPVALKDIWYGHKNGVNTQIDADMGNGDKNCAQFRIPL